MPKTNIVSTIDESKFGTSIVNYVSNPGAESTPNSLTPFNVVISSNAPTGAPTLSSAVAAITVDSTTPLRGVSSYRLSLSSTFGAAIGHGWISDEITLVPSDLGKVLELSLEYKTVSGASYLDLSGTSSQSLEVWIYDVAAAAWVQPAGFRGINASGVASSVKTTFQSSVVAGQKYRVALLAIRSPSSAPVELNVDSIKLGPPVIAQGTPVTDWVSYTPTGTWTTNVTYSGKWRRVGDSMEVRAKVLCSGLPDAVALGINLPSGFSMDTAKLTSTAPGGTPLGYGQAVDVGVQSYPVFITYFGGTTQLGVYDGLASGTFVVDGNVINTGPFTFGATDFVEFIAVVPILGWSSTVQMSNDTDTRVVAFRVAAASSPSGQSIGPVQTKVAMPSATVTTDTHGGWDSTNTRYRVQVSGYYRLSASILYAPTTTVTDQQLNFAVNGSIAYTASGGKSGASSIFSSVQHPGTVAFLKAGDYVELYAYNGLSMTTHTDAGFQWYCIERLSGPSAIAATETVAANYACTAGQSINPASADTMYPFTNLTTKYKDTHGAFNTATGTFTAPVSGTYRVSGSMTTPSGTSTYRTGFGVNTSTGFSVMSILTVNTAVQTSLPCTWQVQLKAGETVTFGGSSTSAIAQTWGAADGRVGWISIERVGN